MGKVYDGIIGVAIGDALGIPVDTDTVGAVAGGLAGIYYGADNILQEWQTATLKRNYVERLCSDFENLLQKAV